MDMSDYAEPLDTELEQIVDEARRDVGRGPAPRDAATGIADMHARIEYHTQLLGKLQRQPDSKLVRDLIADSTRQLTEANERLAEYKSRQQQLN